MLIGACNPTLCWAVAQPASPSPWAAALHAVLSIELHKPWLVPMHCMLTSLHAGLLIAALDWPGSRAVANADRVGRHILFTVINDEDRRKERIESAIGKLHTVKYPADPSKTYADVMLERINAGAANQVLAYLTISTSVARLHASVGSDIRDPGPPLPAAPSCGVPAQC